MRHLPMPNAKLQNLAPQSRDTYPIPPKGARAPEFSACVTRFGAVIASI